MEILKNIGKSSFEYTSQYSREAITPIKIAIGILIAGTVMGYILAQKETGIKQAASEQEKDHNKLKAAVIGPYWRRLALNLPIPK